MVGAKQAILAVGGMLPQGNLGINVINFDFMCTMMPLDMDYLITELSISETFPFSRFLVKA